MIQASLHWLASIFYTPLQRTKNSPLVDFAIGLADSDHHLTARRASEVF